MNPDPKKAKTSGNSTDVSDAKLAVKGTRFYAFAFMCVAVAAGIGFLWSAKVQKVYALSQQMSDQVSAGKFQTAVETCRKIEQEAPRYAKDQWLVSQQELLVKWAKRDVGAGDLSAAIDRAGQAAAINANSTQGHQATEILAGALLAQLELQTSQLTTSQCIRRAQQIASQYSDTQAGGKANELAGQYRHKLSIAQQAIETLEGELGRLIPAGDIVEAVSVLDAYLAKTDQTQLSQLFDESWASTNLGRLIDQADDIWLGRIEGGSGDQWRSWPITADNFLPDWLASPGGRSVFAASEPASPGLPVRLELVAGQTPQPGQILLPVMLEFAEINLLVQSSEGLPLEGIDVYVESDTFPGISQHAWFGTTDSAGRCSFDWPGPGPAMVLLAFQSVPLINATVIPGCEKLTVPDKWQLGGVGVSLEHYVSAKSRQLSEAREQSQARQEHFRQVQTLLAAGNVDQASALLDSLAANDPEAGKLRQAIRISSEMASAQAYLSAADQAHQSGQLGRAFDLLHEALSFADETQRDQVTSRLIRIESQLDQLKHDTAPVRRQLFDRLRQMSINEVSLQIDRVSQAVADIVRANQDRWLAQTGKALTDIINRFDRSIDGRLKEMETDFSKKDDQLTQLLEKRDLLHENLTQIQLALESVKYKSF